MILGMTLHPGEECTRRVEGTEHLIIAALDCRPGKYSDDLHLSSCLLIKHGEYEQVLCTLEKGNVTQQKLDLVLLKNEVITFTVEGTGTIYITGYTTSNNITFDEEGYEVDNAESGPPMEEVTPVDTRANDGVVLLDRVVEDTEPSTEVHLTEVSDDAPLQAYEVPSLLAEKEKSSTTPSDSESSEDRPLQSLLKESVDASKKQSFMESMMLMNNEIQQSEDVPQTGDRLPRPQCKTSRKHRKAKKHRKLKSPIKKEFGCAFCDKPFPTRNAVVRHGRVHTGDKPFSCRLCTKAYSDKSTLSKHILKKHERPPQHPRRPRTCRESKNIKKTQQGSKRLANGCTTDQEETLRGGPRKAEASGLRSSVSNTGQSGIDTTSLKKKLTDQEENCLGVSSGLEGILGEEGHDLEARGQAFHRDVRRQAGWEGTTVMMSLSDVKPDSQIMSPCASSLAEGSTTGDSEATILVDLDMVSLDNEVNVEEQDGKQTKQGDGALGTNRESPEARTGDRVTRNRVGVATADSQTGSGRWYCRKCDLSFYSRNSMRTHRHRTSSSIKCEECKMGFSSRFALRRHLHRHTGEQPYECGLCGRRFNRLDKKKAHENRHRGKAYTMYSVDPQQKGLPQQLCESLETAGTAEQENPQRISSPEKMKSMGRRSSHRNAKRLGNRATPIMEELVVHTGDCSQLSSKQEGSQIEGGQSGLEKFSARTPHRNLRRQSEWKKSEEEETLGNREGSAGVKSEAQMLEGVVPTAVSKEAIMEGVSLKDRRVEVGLGIHVVEGREEGRKMEPTQPVKSKPGLEIASVNQPRVGKRVGRLEKSVVEESRWCCTACDMSFRTRDFLRAHRRKHVRVNHYPETFKKV